MRATAAIFACAALLTGAGCGARGDARPQAARSHFGRDLSTSSQTVPLPVHAQPTAVKEGAAPLVYMVEGGATIRVHDQTAKRDLARSFVAGRSIVRVDGRRGVIYGDDTVFAGPLPQDHRYVIFVDPTGENVARQGVFQLRPRNTR
jgi:hypothetical protein